MSNTLKSASKFLALILRHKPEAIGITLDEHGWADVNEVVTGIAKTRDFDRAMLEEIVLTDSKYRYSFSADGRLIRANHGHSVPVDIELPVSDPPEFLWHGTAQQYVASIEKQGLLPMSRLYVHLSTDIETALSVGRRHGKPVIYRVAAGQMARDGFLFYRSLSGIWLTKEVPPKYLEKQETEEKQ